MADFRWTEEQRRIIQEAIDAEIGNSRLAHKLIRESTLSSDARTVPRNRYNYKNDTVDDAPIALQEPEQQLSIPRLQTEGESLDQARTLVRRAAQQLAREHDRRVFQVAIRDKIAANAGKRGFHKVIDIKPPYSDGVVAAVTTAVTVLGVQGYRTGYVMVAGLNVDTCLGTRSQGAAGLPVKEVQRLLKDGPVHSSDVLDPDEALILSLSGEGEEIDRAVADAPTLEFLRVDNNAVRFFRLYERFITRFKLTYSAVLLRLDRDEVPAPPPERAAVAALADAAGQMAAAAERAATAAEAAACAAAAAVELVGDRTGD